MRKALSVLLTLALVLSLFPVLGGNARAVPETEFVSKDLKIWFDEPADYSEQGWMTQGLPIGNGYMGGMIYGDIETDVVQFNEKTLWTGGPGGSNTSYNYGNTPDAYQNLQTVRELLWANDGWGSADLLAQYNLYGNGNAFGSSQNFGEVKLHFAEGALEDTTGYERYLDLRTGTVGVTYELDGVTYTREYFANYPSNVMVFRYDASAAGKLSFDLEMVSAHTPATYEARDHTITMTGRIPDNQMYYESQTRVIPQNGTITDNADGTITVTGADSVVLLITAGTDYANVYPDYRGENPHDAISQRIAAAAYKGYDGLRAEQLADYQEIFGRVELDLDQEIADVPTDELLMQYNQGQYDPQQIEVLAFQMGRYMLLSSSREGSLPANLQGVWIGTNGPAWAGDYHCNVNLEMCYFPAYLTNMEETAEPLIDYMESLRAPGRVSAAEFFGIESTEEHPENGWMVGTMNNAFGCTAIGSGSWGWAPANAAWLCQNLWEDYTFTGDIDQLRDEIYPIMREAAVFWTQNLVEDPNDGRLVSCPSFSPEQGPITSGNAYEQSLVWELYKIVIEASEVLDVDAELRQLLQEQQARLDPIEIGTTGISTGLIKEWKSQEAEGFPAWDVNHRHTSQLVGLYPGTLITQDTPDFFEAAKLTLETRGDDGTGWGLAHKINMWARLQDGEHAYKLINRQLQYTDDISMNYSHGGTFGNLFCAHPPFQMDGNSGLTAGMAEMLMQSQNGYIQMLPALPQAWNRGSFQGLVARGGFEVDAAWSGMKLTDLEIYSRTGNDCTIEYDGIQQAVVTTADGAPVAVTKEGDNRITFATEQGETYRLKDMSSATVLFDGQVFKDFNMDTDTYTVVLDREVTPDVPEITVETTGAYTAQVEQAAGLPGTATVQVDLGDGTSKTYTIEFQVLNEITVLLDGRVFEEFDPAVTEYTISMNRSDWGHLPVLSYQKKGDVSAQIDQLDALPGTAVMQVNMGGQTTPYTFRFEVQAFDYLSDVPYASTTGPYIYRDTNNSGVGVTILRDGQREAVEKVLSLYPNSSVTIDLTGKGYTSLQGELAIDTHVLQWGNPDGVTYTVTIDGTEVYRKENINQNTAPIPVNIPIDADARTLVITATATNGANNNNWSVWAYGRLTYSEEMSSLAALNAIYLDGKPLEGFDFTTTDYTVELPQNAGVLPEVTVEPMFYGAKTTVEKTGDLSYVLTVFSADETAKTEYTLTFTPFEMAEFDYVTDLPFTQTGMVYRDQNHNGMTVSISRNGVWETVPKALSEYPNATVTLEIAGKGYRLFEAELAIDPFVYQWGDPDGVIYTVLIDGKEVYWSETVDKSTEPIPLQIPIPEDAETLTLQTSVAGSGNNNNWSVWAYARLCYEEQIPATEVQLDLTEKTLEVGQKVQLHAAVVPESTTDTPLWTSTAPSVAEVTADGLVTALAPGRATIAVIVGAQKATCEIEVKEAAHTHSMTHTPAKNPTCTEAGSTEYWYCAGCGKYFSDETGTTEITLDSTVLPALGHDFGTEWTFDESGHWHVCSRCGEKDEGKAHVPGPEATEDDPQVCTECGYILEPATGHIIHTPGTQWYHDETQHWHLCTGCDLKMDVEDHSGGTATCTQQAECEVCGTPYGELAEHDYQWAHDDTQHWKVCADCGAVDGSTYEAHTWVEDEERSGDKTVWYVCQCGAEKKASRVIATPTLILRAEQSDGGAISPESQSVTRGGQVTFTITPDGGYHIADVLVDGRSVGAVSEYTFQNVSTHHTITAVFSDGSAPVETVKGFTDVMVNDWFADAVAYAVDADLMNGTSSTTFSPKGDTTRGMIVTILYRLAGSPDVESDGAAWWSDARVWAMEEGISDGTNMEKAITREQLAAMLYRYAGSKAVDGDLSAFADAASVSDWAVDALVWATEEGIVTGQTGGRLDPQAGATRAETAAMLQRYGRLEQ